MRLRQGLVFLLVLGVTAVANVASADVIVTVSDSSTAPTLPANDLILQGSGTLEGSYLGGDTTPMYGSWALINDGTMSYGGPSTIIGWDGTTADFGWSVFQLNLATNTLGYDVSEILSYAGWTDDRTDQAVEIKYALVGDTINPGSELGRTLGPFNYDAEPGAAYTTMSITDDASPLLLPSGVAAVEVKYLNNGFGVNQSAYTEFAVIGTATVPEPSTWVLLTCGLFGLLVRGTWRKGR